MSALLLVLIGIAALFVGGAALVRGASGVAAQFGVSPLLVGLTIVAFGTSSPELVVVIIGALENQTELVFGNIIGSNSANLGLVLGVAGIVAPIVMRGALVRRELPLLLLSTFVVLVMSSDLALRGSSQMIDRSDAMILLLLFAGFLYVTIGEGFRKAEDPVIAGVRQLPVASMLMRERRNWLYVLAGTFGLGLGGHLTVTYGAELALALGLAPVMVGIVVVAVGTSLPELIASVVAAVKNEPDICIGNVVGSNLCNGLLVLPLGALIRPIPIPPGGMFDIVVSLLFAAALIPIFISGKARLGRPAGLLLLSGYVTYLVWRGAYSG